MMFLFPQRVDSKSKPQAKSASNWVLLFLVGLYFSQSPSTIFADDGVLNGIDVLQRDKFKLLADQRVGLITNHTGLNRDGVSTVKLLNDAKNVSLKALFSPEHGFEGKLDVSKIGDTKDQSTGLIVFSLYGATRRPTEKMLDEIDTLVFDIQDIGARFYTYVSTMGEAMTQAAAQGKRFVVLDRPNPINGINVAGPMLDAGEESFVGYHHLPVRHGMTTGELAMMLNKELKLNLNLHVVKCEGWQRNQFWDETSLVWVNPSPNMRCLTQALLYPGIGLIETTNLSVGRGTDTPFEVIGAPWINPRELADALNRQETPGVSYVPIRYTPSSSKYKDEECGGVNIIITNRDQFEPLRVGFEVSTQLQKLYPNDWKGKDAMRLLGNRKTLDAILAGDSAENVKSIAEQGVDQFLKRRESFLLY
ncbi:exo-beta-N-acetylmuramidase NamZ domain-containing protein [Thalassoglobus sp.]|uniref:exo-beta-N-acetylmuramidase NamZ family protein n=1 Tax=Thalassoglobus sp. TaxID=2795869 RepID=UPI003AA957C6